ncbi:MAG: hypothetical protein COV76_04835 [Candidatus Omnitrophica bacterium CG11_big_fil_rev_8_21_14_0_20_64_10]|nr:MAG: hypothetical protein COV76_04835 [Candidatus Omnitrophica bacterium CG11_big_fil_rev_8_21_14_0_20_64_10]
MTSDQRWLFGAAFFRAGAVGLISVLFSLYLAAGGLHAGQIGGLIAAGVVGTAVATFGVAFWADRVGRKRFLIGLVFFQMIGGVGLIGFPSTFLLYGLVFLGMVNAMGRERGAAFTLEQAILPETTTAQNRTGLLAWYNMTVDLGLGVGALLGGLPALIRARWGVGELDSYRWALGLYLLFSLLSLFMYLFLSHRVEIHDPAPWHRVPPATRKTLTRLSLLFGFDSFSGGFLPAALIAYWFFRRFGADEKILGPLFAAGYFVNATSYLVAAWLARRIGLIRTMVFTHIPASLCVIALPFVPSLGWAMGLYILREFLAEMDVPTRQSYVTGIVAPSERSLASGVTNLSRTAAWTVGPGIAGWIMRFLNLGAPLWIGGGLKILYDLMLYRDFRHLKTPEEQAG